MFLYQHYPSPYHPGSESESPLTSLCPRPNPHLQDISHMFPVHFHCSSFSSVVLHGSTRPAYRLLIIFHSFELPLVQSIQPLPPGNPKHHSDHAKMFLRAPCGLLLMKFKLFGQVFKVPSSFALPLLLNINSIVYAILRPN